MDARASRDHQVYARWQRDPQGFWGEAAQAIDWMEPPRQVFDPDAGVYGRWFAGGVCNTCWNAVDRHVMQGRGEQPAIIYDSPLAGQKRTISYYRLQVETQVLAAILRNFGVGKGDRVVLYMPMVPEAVVAMLACAASPQKPCGSSFLIARNAVGAVKKATAPCSEITRQNAPASGVPTGLPSYRTEVAPCSSGP